MNYDLVCSFDELDIIKGDETEEYNKRFIGRMSGWASTPNLDSDGERVLQDGLVVDELLHKGWINWNHQSAELIGVPRVAEVRDRGSEMGKGLYTEFDLLRDAPMAQKTWELAKALKGTGRSLGLSLEGKKLAVSKTGTILKAKVMNIAVCPNPKNPETSVQALVKAMVTNDEAALAPFSPIALHEESIVSRVSEIVASTMTKALDAGYDIGGTTQEGGAAQRKEEIGTISREDQIILPPGHTLREWDCETGELKKLTQAIIKKADTRGGAMTRIEASLLTFLAGDPNTTLSDSFRAYGLLEEASDEHSR